MRLKFRQNSCLRQAKITNCLLNGVPFLIFVLICYVCTPLSLDGFPNATTLLFFPFESKVYFVEYNQSEISLFCRLFCHYFECILSRMVSRKFPIYKSEICRVQLVGNFYTYIKQILL